MKRLKGIDIMGKNGIDVIRDNDKVENKDIQEIRIKVLTYNNMYYTVAVINKNVSEVIEYKELENCSTSLSQKIRNVANWSLQDLYYKLINEQFIFSRFENKIINVKEIKETFVIEYPTITEE